MGMENLAARHTMLDLMTYADDGYKRELFDAVRQSLGRIAQEGGSALPLCVVAHGFGSILAIDFFKELQRLSVDTSTEAERAATPLERGETLAFFCTMGSPAPLVVPALSADRLSAEAPSALDVPSAPVLERWPHLRGGWTNFYHRGDCLGHPLRSSQATISDEVECRRRHKGDLPIQSSYFEDVVDCVGPIAQSISWVWQDTNRTTTLKRSASRGEQPMHDDSS
jgi:hypothetical protein